MALWLKHKTWHHETPRGEQKQSILRHKSYQCFLRSVSQGSVNKNKNKQIGHNQTYKFLYLKGNNKTDYTTQ